MTDTARSNPAESDHAGFDSSAHLAQQRRNWDSVGREVAEFVDDLESGLRVVSDRLVQLAQLRPGQTVLDVGTGYGEPALSTARAVGPTGRVVGVDLSQAMLEIARHRAEGMPNLTFEVGDFASVSTKVPVDAVVSRFALMQAPDRVAALRHLGRLLIPGGVLAAAVWGPAENNLFVTGLSALVRELGLPTPPAGAPGPFAMSNRDLIIRELSSAGFRDVHIEELVAPFVFNGAARYGRLHWVVMPRQLRGVALQRLGSRRAVQDVLQRAVEPYLTPDGSLPLPSLAYCMLARTSPA
jgi:enediyne biosynthesis protein CalE5